jgi:hypothetical protein
VRATDEYEHEQSHPRCGNELPHTAPPWRRKHNTPKKIATEPLTKKDAGEVFSVSKES